MNGRARFTLFPLLFLAVAGPGCSEGEQDGPIPIARDVVLVVFDTTRFDRTSLGGHAGARNPALDRLARDGVVFERAYAPVPVTLPSHATLLSGRSPLVHGIRQNGTSSLDPAVPRVPARFQQAGFRTAAFVSSLVLDARFGLDRGFDVYDSPARAERRADETVTQAIAWMRAQDREQRLFLWVHFYDPHFPYQPPADFSALDPYDGEIAAADAALGRLLDALDGLGRLEASLVAVLADHGEGLSDHGEEEHGIFLYEEAIHVPLLLRLPGGARGGRRVGDVVELADVGPTLLARAGLPALERSEGIDLTPCVEGRAAGARAAYAESHVPQEIHGFAPLFAWVEGDRKFIDAPRAELYDLAEDPGETRNTREREAAAAARMLAALNEHRARLAPGAFRAPAVRLEEVERRQLEALGYLGGGGRAAGSARVDPKDGIHAFNRLRGAALLVESDPAAARSEIEDVLRLDAGNRSALAHLERALLALGLRAEAIARWQEHLSRDPGFFEGWLRLGALYGQDDPAAAASAFRRAASVEPGNYEAAYNLAQALRQLGDARGALEAYERALVIDRSAQALNALAWHLATSPQVLDPARAEVLAREALRLEPGQAEYHDTLAEALAGRGDLAGAVQAMQEAVRLDPSPTFQARLADFLRRAGR
ncbi:MAG: sulfatase-like hydrolase/transferase [Planctomycetes bacterium]|nr:sulfatase-like hydrolase/transferase [Planctomycetota bacterium]